MHVDFTGLYVDLDNGYDAWAIDNGFHTYSDDPGRDAQRSVAGSARVRAELDSLDVVSITGFAETDATFSFDADWGNPAYWAPYVYDYVTTNDRERRMLSQELRLLSKPGAIADGRGDWLVGMYVLDLGERNDHRDVGVYDDDSFCDPCELDNPVVSDYDATSFAVFGQATLALNDRLGLTAGLRWEQRSAEYGDTNMNAFSPDDDMLGGEVALDWQLADRRSVYLRLARGYKAGGFNVSLAGVDFGTVDNVNLSPENIEFDAESLTSIEAGFRASSADGRLRADIGVFVAQRDDQQIKVPLQLQLGDPSSFLFVTDNAERGGHHGVEATAAWQATQRFELSAAVGLLRTEINEFSLFPELAGREQAHAPDYTYSLGATYSTPSGWWARLDLSGMDAFFYDYGHDQTSEPYELANLSVGPRLGLVERQALDAQRVRRELLRARLLFRQRAAGFSTDAVHEARRPAPLRHHVELSIVGAAMRVTAEMSLYPLQGQPLEKILAFIETITGDSRLEVVVNQLSTQVRGELGVVMSTITTAIERSFGGGGSQALVLKILNADLPIGEPPVLEPR